MIWFGKSERPEATIAAPARLASLGIISGVGLAMAKITALLAMVWMSEALSRLPFETPMKTSELLRASESEPKIFSLFVILRISFFIGVRSRRPPLTIP